MKEFKYVITDPEGIHARPAGELVKAAKEFAANITLTKDGSTNIPITGKDCLNNTLFNLCLGRVIAMTIA